MTKDEMIGWFRAAPIGSRHERMLWAAHKIARLTGATEGGVYQLLLVALIEAERLPRGSILGFSMTADECSVSRGSQPQRQVREPFNDANDVIIITTPLRLSKKLRSLPSSLRGIIQARSHSCVGLWLALLWQIF